MTTDEPSAPAGFPPEKRQRKAPTIELTATEVQGAANRTAEAGPSAGETQLSDDGPTGGQGGENAPSEDAQSTAKGSAQRYYGTALWLAAAAGAAGGACVSLLFLVANPFAAPTVDLSGVNSRLTQIEGTLRDRSSTSTDMDQKKLDQLAGRIDKLEGAIATPRPMSDMGAANRLAAIEGELRTLSESVGLLGRRNDEIAGAAREARQRTDTTAAALADLTQKVTSATGDAIKKMESDLQNALSRLTEVERAEKTIETALTKRPDNRDPAARFALAATALNSAVESGKPFVPELAGAKSLAATPAALAPLEPFAATGVPTTAAVARELAALVPQLMAAGGASAPNGSFLEKLQANAEKLVRIRPLDEAQGSDTTAVVMRAENKASKGDIPGALAELETLPQAVRVLAEPWMTKAQARLAAVAAARQLATDAFAGIGK
jgi:hypothetical protein